MPIGDYSGGSTSSSKSSKSSPARGGAAQDMGNAKNQAASAKAASAKAGGVSTGGGNDNTVDPGFQQALKEQAKRQSDPVWRS